MSLKTSASLHPSQPGGWAPPVHEATGGHGSSGVSGNSAPSVAKKEKPVEEKAVEKVEKEEVVEKKEEKVEEPKEPKKREPRKKASSLSLSALMDEEEVEIMPAAGTQAAAEEKPEALPEDGALAGQWKELAAQFASQPRLANALSNANLSFREEDGRKVVAFTVTNEAQKKWIEERILRDLESKFARLTGCGKFRLEPTVLPEEEQEKKIYMPSEKAEDLMSKNEEVRNLVVDLGLDIK